MSGSLFFLDLSFENRAMCRVVLCLTADSNSPDSQTLISKFPEIVGSSSKMNGGGRSDFLGFGTDFQAAVKGFKAVEKAGVVFAVPENDNNWRLFLALKPYIFGTGAVQVGRVSSGLDILQRRVDDFNKKNPPKIEQFGFLDDPVEFISKDPLSESNVAKIRAQNEFNRLFFEEQKGIDESQNHNTHDQNPSIEDTRDQTPSDPPRHSPLISSDRKAFESERLRELRAKIGSILSEIPSTDPSTPALSKKISKKANDPLIGLERKVRPLQPDPSLYRSHELTPGFEGGIDYLAKKVGEDRERRLGSSRIRKVDPDARTPAMSDRNKKYNERLSRFFGHAIKTQTDKTN